MYGLMRHLSLIFIDFLIINIAFICSYFVRFEEQGVFISNLVNYIKISPVIVGIYLACFYYFKIYKRVWAYASIGELITIVQAVSLGSGIIVVLTYLTGLLLPRTIVLASWAFIILLLGSSRLCWRLNLELKKNNCRNGNGYNGQKVLIVGAGDAGVLVARELKNHDSGLVPAGFIDDDPNKCKLSVLGLPVFGNRDKIEKVVNKYDIKLIIIAMPSATAQQIKQIFEICRKTNKEVKILPGYYQLINGNVTISQLRPVKIEDLLHREPVKLNINEISGYIKGETVLVTGAGGSIGSELCRQVAGFKPKLLVILGHGENSIHKIWLELTEKFKDIPLGVEIADIRDKHKINAVFKKYHPGVVFHAAAHKHVPLMEYHPDEAVKTNVLGTKNLVDAADKHGAKQFVQISTDKAVNPSSVMGATKRLAELIIQNMDRISNTRFVAVRFGNVLGSRGSVVPIFEQQIAKRGPVTVTHPEMKRYFMTIPEAVQLVIQAGSMADGGEIFILDMGEPVKIVDLARDMIKLSGLEPGKDIEIKFTGMRPGEKLFEELLTEQEGATATTHKRIFVAKPSLIEVSELEKQLLYLSENVNHIDNEAVFEVLGSVLPHFKSYRNKVTAV
ncbi:polysaccharide biosynthesis protein [Desulfotruncus alcoholivorax]|uniref:polysaccharide biosynthesis protein n=1 Tax=Desulfotruncus alcoholivorax TaxID=265477 RepID=UPI0003FEA16F|nr:nucleoside-diphosphate sugar epimerase/dehydratase [Desulfotruncus alcoholivorax]